MLWLFNFDFVRGFVNSQALENRVPYTSIIGNFTELDITNQIRFDPCYIRRFFDGNIQG